MACRYAECRYAESRGAQLPFVNTLQVFFRYKEEFLPKPAHRQLVLVVTAGERERERERERVHQISIFFLNKYSRRCWKRSGRKKRTLVCVTKLSALVIYYLTTQATLESNICEQYWVYAREGSLIENIKTSI
jgi:hypothetical protein